MPIHWQKRGHTLDLFERKLDLVYYHTDWSAPRGPGSWPLPGHKERRDYHHHGATFGRPFSFALRDHERPSPERLSLPLPRP